MGLVHHFGCDGPECEEQSLVCVPLRSTRPRPDDSSWERGRADGTWFCGPCAKEDAKSVYAGDWVSIDGENGTVYRLLSAGEDTQGFTMQRYLFHPTPGILVSASTLTREPRPQWANDMMNDCGPFWLGLLT